MKITLTIVLLSLSITFLKGQSEFELLIDLQGDTMLSGMHAIEANDGYVYLLTNVDIFEPGDGIPIEGYLNIGIGLTIFDSNGDEVFNDLYIVNFYPGRIPASKFYFNSENEIIIPFIRHAGLLLCNDGSYFLSDKKNVLKLSDSGVVLDITDQSLDTECSWDKMVSSGLSINDEILIFRRNSLDVNQYMYLDIYNNNLDLIYSDTVFNILGGIYDSFLEQIVVASQLGVRTFTFQGDPIDTFAKIAIVSLTNRKRNSFITEDYYFYITGGNLNGIDSLYATEMYLMNRQGEILSEKVIYGVAYDKVAIDSNNIIYLLADNSHYNKHDSIPLPVRVAVLDFDLNILGEKDFGFPFVSTNSIVATQDGFLVSGVRYKSYDIVNGKEKDQAYILKGTLDQLVGIEENLVANQSIKLYPNPANEFFILDNNNRNSIQKIEIRNITGQLVIKLYNPKNRVNISVLKPGIYLVAIETNKGIVTKKLIKQQL